MYGAYIGIVENENYYLGSRVEGFPKLGLPFGVPIVRTIIFWGLC